MGERDGEKDRREEKRHLKGVEKCPLCMVARVTALTRIHIHRFTTP
jgi:hypothetical protein